MARHRRVAEIGELEIWETPGGKFGVYSPSAKIAEFSTEGKASAYAALKRTA